MSVALEKILLIDTHCHLDFAIFDHDRKEVVERAQNSGVVSIVLPGVTRETWPRLKQVVSDHQVSQKHCLNNKHEDGRLADRLDLFACYGLHPMFMDEHKDEDIHALEEWVGHNSTLAIGECGLDYFIPNPDSERQERLFESHVRLAYEMKLPLIIHARKALDRVLMILRRYPGVRGVIHSFSGSEQQALSCIKNGMYLGFGGPVTYPRAQRLKRLIKFLPEDAILLETDAPDQPDASHKGLRNEPSYLPAIAQTIADIRGCDIKDLAQCTLRNTKELFGTGIITQ